ncbi:hypothetical protein SVI_3790 [Shewanella violacea DSS12]|uniref:Uncharacterized protein n=1 Tax=Shewanella violacea (strain JCM 10179 / CIP 106290 / LMG 19151 / DSS12) TaxID=637905 RepID=D4ZCL6_SHEVD|nr:hypothetical protein SVI_3790 [Shewanella violacea DSS12]
MYVREIPLDDMKLTSGAVKIRFERDTKPIPNILKRVMKLGK